MGQQTQTEPPAHDTTLSNAYAGSEPYFKRTRASRVDPPAFSFPMAGCNFTPPVLNITSLFLNYFESILSRIKPSAPPAAASGHQHHQQPHQHHQQPHQAISTTSSRIRPPAAASGHQHHQQPHQATSSRIRPSAPPAAASGHQQPHQDHQQPHQATSSRIRTTSSRIRPPAASGPAPHKTMAVNPGD